jgi:small conductance mechanosensitive channel
VIEDAGGNLKIVNNSDIRNLQNRSRNTSLAVCDIGVSYETEVAKLGELLKPGLEKIYEKHRDLFIAKPIYKGVERFEDSSVVIRFTAETKEDEIFNARRCLNEEIFCLLHEKQIEIPYPHVEIVK